MSNACKAIHSSKSVEWYTPSRYIEAARWVMGGIELDPASCANANKIVRAQKYFNQQINGLVQPWHGRVWLNMPYGKTGNTSNQEIWLRKIWHEWSHMHIEQAIVLVNAVPDRQWFQGLWNYPICFTDHRIRFLDRYGDEQKSPTHGNAFVYFCNRADFQLRRFREGFTQFGHVVIP
jgi:ParB family chromosome partitioning protein